MRTLALICLSLAMAMATAFVQVKKRETGSCPGTCVDIKNKPTCDGYIHLGLCDNGLGCCIGGGGGGGASAASASQAAAVAAAVPMSPSGGKGSCQGTCVDIKNKPTCSGYIHLGLCEDGLGCCSEGGGGGGSSSATANEAVAVVAPPPAVLSSGGGKGSCSGTCVDIKQNPSCSGYIRLGLCENGLGCCEGSSGGGGGGVPAASSGKSDAGPPAVAPPAPAASSGGQGSCDGTCVDIKKDASCPGYIHLGLCENGLGCCKA